MIVDTSALIAILKREPDWEIIGKALDSADDRRISAPTYLELSIVVDRWKTPALSGQVDELLKQFRISVEPFSADQAFIARQAYREYGKGSGHPANLNFGDCFTYALASVKREPVLFKGNDFNHTDLRSALEGVE